MINPFPGASADVLVDMGARVLRIQVKSVPHVRGYSNGAGRRYARYEFRIAQSGTSRARYAGKSIDLFAFVALDLKLVCYLSAEEVLRSKLGCSKVFTRESFLAAATDSLERCLAAL